MKASVDPKLKVEGAELLHFDKRDLCFHRWEGVSKIDLANPGRTVLPRESRCTRCGWQVARDGIALPKFGTAGVYIAPLKVEGATT
jgi:hypothetical protein